MHNEKEEKKFLEDEARTFSFGKDLFGEVFQDYSLFFMDYPKNFKSIKMLAELHNYTVKERSVITVDDKPFGLDQFLLLAPMLLFLSSINEIVYGRNKILNEYLENFYSKDPDSKVNYFSLKDLEEVAYKINHQ